MKKSIVRILILLAIINTGFFAQQLHKTGLIFEDASKISWIKKAGRKPVLEKLPSYVDNSAHLPPVAEQVSSGGCGDWAVGYYYKTYEEWQDYGWSTTDPNHIFSPMFILNIINQGPNGEEFTDLFKVLLDNGCATIAECPCNASGYTSWPSEAVLRDAINYRDDSVMYISTIDMQGIEQVKQHIANGNIAILGFRVYQNFYNFNNYNNTYSVNDLSGPYEGNHAINLVGYDDNKVTADGMGAFKLVNEWGSLWGDSGFAWISYEAVMNSTISSQQVIYAIPKKHYKPLIVASVQINFPAIDRLSIAIGIGPDAVPLYTKSFFNFDLDRTGQPVIHSPATKIVFDLTDGLNYINDTTVNNIFIKTRSGFSGAGTVNSFSVTDLRTGYTVNSSEVPNAIPNGVKNVFTNVTLKVLNSYVGSKTLSLIKGWNLVSVPLLQSDNSAGNLFPGAILPAYNYTNKYNMVTTLSMGTGYWIYYPDTATININGTIVDSTAIPLSEGWNLIGVYGKNVAVDQLMNSSWGIISSPFYGYENGYQIPALLEPGMGYWVRASQAGILNIAGALAKGINQLYVKQNIDSRWIKISVTDKKGNQKTIYGTLESINLNNFALPPVPPNGIFDLRWVSNQLVDNINDGAKDILISSAVYPLTLKIEGGNLSISDAIDGKVLNEVVKDGQSLNISNPAIDKLAVKLEEIPASFELSQNYPNPFNPGTTISYQIPMNNYVTLKVYDLLGREVRTLVNEFKSAGKYSLTFDGSSLSSGVYFYKLQAGNFTDTKKLIILK